MPNAETERNEHEGQCAARIGTDCSPPHVWHLATPLNERNNEFFLLKGFTSTYLKETRFSFHAHFSWGPPPLGVISENGHPQLAGPNRPSPVRPQTKSMATGLARDEIANGSRTGRQAENYSLKHTKAPPSLRRATSPFSNSALSLFWAVLLEMPGSIAITSPTPSSIPVDSKHLKTSFSSCLMRCSSSGESEARLGAAR